jgi:hypothetical protein
MEKDRETIQIAIPQTTEWQRIGNQIDTAMIFTRAHFVNVFCAIIENGQHLQLRLAHYFVVEPRKYCTANQSIEERVHQSDYAADWRNRITKIHLAEECEFSGRAKCDGATT